jgi:uncharacterized membrane-anchored protein
MNKLKIVLGLQLLFFVAWGGSLLSSRNADSPEFYLETTPVDPRDLISGTYVALNYEITSPQAGDCGRLMNSALTMYVKLEDLGKRAETEQGQVAVYQAAACAAAEPASAGWARASIQPSFGRRTSARYGIEKFFLNENDPRKDARSGSVLAKVKIDGSRHLVLLDLVSKI